MDFDLPEEIRQLKDTVRKFVDRELIPLEGRSLEDWDLQPEIRASLEAKAKDIRLWLLEVSEEFGGAGLGLLANVVVWEEVARTTALPPLWTRHLWPGAAPHPIPSKCRAERALPLSGLARRKTYRLRSDRAGCRIRSRDDADHSSETGWPLHQ